MCSNFNNYTENLNLKIMKSKQNTELIKQRKIYNIFGLHEIAIENPNQGEWVSLDIPLTDFVGLTTKANMSQYIYSGDTSGAITVHVDNVYFHK